MRQIILLENHYQNEPYKFLIQKTKFLSLLYTNIQINRKYEVPY